MPPLKAHEVENLRRSVAMLPPGARDGLSREKALDVLEQLIEQLIEVLHCTETDSMVQPGNTHPAVLWKRSRD